MEPFSLIGYFPKRVVCRPDWLKVPRVKAIRSASLCVSEGPDGWIDNWRHNELWVFSTLADALSVIPEGRRSRYEVHAYRMMAASFDGGERRPFDVPALDVEPLPSSYESLGFDAVSRSQGNAFECSPLSCNSLAEEVETNEHCLLSTLALAEEIALRFSREEPEPGPYYVVEVLRQQM